MERKIMALACVLAAIVITAIIISLTVLPSSPIETTISEIISNPETWENRKVRVEGVIGSLIHIPEVIPPYNYGLVDKDNGTISIGVRWEGEVGGTQFVAVTGVIKRGVTGGLMGGGEVYYIQAQKIEVLE